MVPDYITKYNGYVSNQSDIHENIHVIRYFPHLNVFEHESQTTKTTQLN